jgi:hypothetical protein
MLTEFVSDTGHPLGWASSIAALLVAGTSHLQLIQKPLDAPIIGLPAKP